MRNTVSITVIAVCSLFLFLTPADGQGYPQELYNNTYAGMYNTLTCWTPIFTVPANEVQGSFNNHRPQDAIYSFPVGIVAGACATGIKAVAGPLQLATGWIPGIKHEVIDDY